MDETGILETVMRNMGAAWRTMRLYPPSSPLPLQAANGVCGAVEQYVEAGPSLRLVVGPGGFSIRGVDGLLTGPGIPEMADALASHSVAEVRFDGVPLASEVVSFLEAVQRPPHEFEGTSGLAGALTAAGVGAIKVVPVAISRVEAALEIPEDEADAFLAELAADADRFTMWLRSLLTYDDEALIEALLEISAAVRDPGVLARSMSIAFLEQDTRGKDRLIEMCMELEPVRTIATDMLANLSCVELTAAIRGGRYGANPLALSGALTRLPMGERSAERIDETRSALRAADADETEVSFLERMIAARNLTTPERPLIETGPLYRSVADCSRIPSGPLAATRDEMEAHRTLDEVGVRTLTHLLESADHLDDYGRVMDALARAVPHLLASGDPGTAIFIVRTLADPHRRPSRPWPDLDARHARAVDSACGVDSMTALIEGSTPEEETHAHARELVELGGEKAAWNLAEASLTSDAEGAMSCAEAVLGRRLPELLAPRAATADARHAAHLAELFARDGGPRCMQALSVLVGHSEERVRSATAKGICAAGGAARGMHVPALLRDPAATVALVTATALARALDDEAIAMFADRLAEVGSDSELPLAREVITALTHAPGEVAGAALTRLADHAPLLQRHKMTEVRALAQRALASRARGVA